jgi:hypothetical protein
VPRAEEMPPRSRMRSAGQPKLRSSSATCRLAAERLGEPFTLERERNGNPPVRVELAEDGSLEWSDEPQECEQGLLDDLQALVDAGLGER